MSRPNRRPAYQNKEKFWHNPNSVLTRKILEIKHDCLCYRCDAQIEWRKTYRKYKIIKEPRRCNGCKEKAVNRSYHTLCDPCARTKGVCAKCGQPCDEATRPKKVTDDEMARRLEHSDIRERLKKTIMRNWERGLLVNEDIMVIIDKSERGIPIDWRDYKQDGEDLDLSDLDEKPLARAKPVTATKKIEVPDLPEGFESKADVINHNDVDVPQAASETTSSEEEKATKNKKITILPKQVLKKTTKRTAPVVRSTSLKSSTPSEKVPVYREYDIQDQLRTTTVSNNQ